MDSKTRIKNYIRGNFPEWKNVDFAEFGDEINFKRDLCDIFQIKNGELIIIAYANLSITGSDRPKPQFRVFLDEYKKPFLFAKNRQMRFYLLSIFTKDDEMARGLNNFNPKDYIISIETNLDIEGARRDLRSIYEYANNTLNGEKFLKCTRTNYSSDINEASFVYIGSEENPEKDTFENFINIFDSRPYINSTLADKNRIKAQNELSEFDDDNLSLNYLCAIRTKPFLLLAGISGTGKSRIVRKLAQATVTEELQKKYTPTFTSSGRWDLHSPANFELIQVKPNWHNSMDVVGYLSNIPTPHYVFTPFINFIIKAWLNPEVPFFLCVDEMNLAPVEEYFAEFLSAIESRGFEGGEYITDPIIPPFNTFNYEDENGAEVKIGDLMINSLLSNFKPCDADTLKGKLVTHLKDKGLTLPKNLIVVGTVNMDETTFSFSRKVLDRAMSIEMNSVDYRSFLADATDDGIKAVVNSFKNGDIKDNDGNPITINQLLVDRHVEAKEIVDDLGGNSEESDARFVIEYLERLNALLEGTPFKLGYRAANEALIYLRSTQEFGFADRESAMDRFTLMKILSRIEGDETKLKITDSEHDRRRLDLCNIDEDSATQHGALTVLTALRAIIADHLGEYVTTPSIGDTDDSREESDVNPQTTSTKEYRASIKKIDSMISQLDRDHFVSYWS